MNFFFFFKIYKQALTRYQLVKIVKNETHFEGEEEP